MNLVMHAARGFVFLQLAGAVLAQSDVMASARWSLAGNGEMQTVRAEDSPGGNESALRVNTRGVVAATPWSTQLSAVVPPALAQGQWLRYRLWARSASSNRIELIHELSAAPNTKSLSYLMKLTPEWKEYAIPYPSAQYNAAVTSLRIRVGYDTGVVELAGLALEDFGTGPASPPAVNFSAFGGQDANDDWREAANARIDRYRKGTLRIKVVDRNGAPITDAGVAIEQTRHAFRFGTAVADSPLLGSGANADRYRAELTRLFNYSVLENALKWQFRNGDFSTADRMLTWLRDNNIPVRGHNLLWPSYQYLPQSAQGLRGDPLRKAIELHVKDYASRAKDRVVVWDVVNEAYTSTEVFRDGGRDLLWLPYVWAREVDPKVELAYNDNNISNVRGGANDAHRNAVLRIVRELLDNVAPVTVLGDQAHMNPPLTPLPRVLETWDELGQFNLPIEVTEFDVTFGGPRDEASQAKYLGDYMTAAFSHPKVTSFVMWGFWDGAHWLSSQGAGMFRQDWSRRPMADVYEQLLFKDWWTRIAAGTNEGGILDSRVFLGDHKVSVYVGEKIVTAAVQVRDNEEKVTEITIEVPE